MKVLCDLVFLVAAVCVLLLALGGGGAAADSTRRGNKVALLIIDVQDCFLPGGSLAVTDGEQVIPVINKIRRDQGSDFSAVVLSQDWHCPRHVSFASQHPGAAVYSQVNVTYNASGDLCYGDSVPYSYPFAQNCSGEGKVLSQTMWPDHCIENVTSGPTSAEFSDSLTHEPTDIVIKKGTKCWLDSYSAFFDNGGFHQTDLDRILTQKDIGVVVVTGLALDFCVYYTSKDAHTLGYKVLTVTDAARGVANSSTDRALQDLRSIGVELVQSKDLGAALERLTSVAPPPSSPTFVFLLSVAAFVVTSFSCQWPEIA